MDARILFLGVGAMLLVNCGRSALYLDSDERPGAGFGGHSATSGGAPGRGGWPGDVPPIYGGTAGGGSGGGGALGGSGGRTSTGGRAGTGGNGRGGVSGTAGIAGSVALAGSSSGLAGEGGAEGMDHCGDGVVDPPDEQCDDANNQSGDGCAWCHVEPIAIATGGAASCVLGSHGLLLCWGYNGYGGLGLGDTENRGNRSGELGARLPTLDLGTNRRVVAVTKPGNHACAVLDNGTVKCWGDNSQGQLGLGDTEHRGDGPGEMGDALPVVDLGSGRLATAVTLGSNSACALLDDGRVKCWGANDRGQLGLGDTNYRGDEPFEMGDALPAVDLGAGRVAVQISGSCALLDDSTVKCWGPNDFGALGLGDSEDRGDEPGEMGDALPAIELGTGKFPVQIQGEGGVRCALFADETVKCWGWNPYGSLGLGDTGDRGDDPDEMGDALPIVDLGTGARPVEISGSCALLADGTIKCWGYNYYGTLGAGDTENRGDEPGEMGDALDAVSLGAGRSVRHMSSDGLTVCALLTDAAVKCWGRNGAGRLGLGDEQSRGDQLYEMDDYLPVLDLRF